jgi:hypothetical protein
MTIRQLRLKHQRAIRTLDAAYARRRAAIIKLQKAQLRERLSYPNPNNWRGTQKSKAAKMSALWHKLVFNNRLLSNKVKI